MHSTLYFFKKCVPKIKKAIDYTYIFLYNYKTGLKLLKKEKSYETKLQFFIFICKNQ